MHRMGGFCAARRIAGRQHGVVTVGQLRALGFSARQVGRGVERGELRRVWHGVYFLGNLLLPYSLDAAAVLACGRGAVLSHRSAAELYEMLPREEGPFHVTVHDRRRREHPGIVVHETRSLEEHEIRERHGIPVTSPIRRVIDLAGTATTADLERAVTEAFAQRLTTLPSLQRAATAYRGRRGVGRVDRLLEAGPRLTRSPPERRLLQAIRRSGLPEPESNGARTQSWPLRA